MENQTVSNGEATAQKFNLSTCQHKQKKHKISDQFCKGRRILEQSSNNTEQMDVDQAISIYLHEEILMNILSRLSVRSLLKFKCVSKFWKTLISDPYFKRKHLNLAKNDRNSHKLLISYKCPKDGFFSTYYCPLSPDQLVKGVQKLSFPLNSKPWQCAIHCCCDGLALMVVCDDEHTVLLLWNPSTRESIVLPHQEIPLKGLFVRFGMGYDSTSGEYKILEFHEVDEVKLCCEILSLRSGSWRKIDKHPCGFDIVLDGMNSLAFVHEAFHWIGTSSNYYSVISLSISNEVYGEIPLPVQIGGKVMIGVSELEGMLCVHTSALFEWTDTFKLWAMKEYGVKESWHALFTIEEPWTVSAVPKYRFADGDVLFWSFRSGGDLFRTSRGPFELWPRVAYQFGNAFTESLISPKSLI